MARLVPARVVGIGQSHLSTGAGVYLSPASLSCGAAVIAQRWLFGRVHRTVWVADEFVLEETAARSHAQQTAICQNVPVSLYRFDSGHWCLVDTFTPGQPCAFFSTVVP